MYACRNLQSGQFSEVGKRPSLHYNIRADDTVNYPLEKSDLNYSLATNMSSIKVILAVRAHPLFYSKFAEISLYDAE